MPLVERPMVRVLVVSRIFAPEPAAASFRLRALTDALDDAGAHVMVLTTRLPPATAGTPDGTRAGVRVRRWPVLRDADGYVRGYLQYMSFDVPVFFRVLLARGVDVVVNEPPPTTGFMVRLACAVRRTPYVYYACDILGDAVGTTSAPAVVVRVVRAVEGWAWRGARAILSVSAGVTRRLAELGVSDGVHEVGNGIDIEAFRAEGDAVVLPARDDAGSDARSGVPYFVYAGTASEVHGAGIFARAMLTVHAADPRAQLVFIGQGAEKAAIAAECASLPTGTVTFLPQAPPQEVARWLRGAVASLASVRPGGGYDFSFPTKIYASVACGTPALYAGVGPARTLVAEEQLGRAVDYDDEAVAGAMLAALEAHDLETEPVADRGPSDAETREHRRARLASWAAENASLAGVAREAARVVTAAADR
ncbi:glycosyltransferase [Sanguibacter sp. 25GB23B1]|uniref:glycosyltransferase n=1 Tax=unclassified Sanguibacter TaxID=2645534 RepID=UPI0032AFDB75